MRRTDERHGATERRARRTRGACGGFSDGDDACGNQTAIGRASIGASRDHEGRALDTSRRRASTRARARKTLTMPNREARPDSTRGTSTRGTLDAGRRR